MMRELTVAVALSGFIALTLATRADMIIAWAHPNGYYDNEDVGDAVAAAGGDLYSMLIWTPDGNVGPPCGDLAGGGIVLAEGLLVADFGGDVEYGWGACVNIAEPNLDPLGFVVSRVFQANSAANAATSGVWYYDSDTIALLDKSLFDGPQIIFANRDLSSNGGFGGDPINTGQCLLPEPTTLTLLLVGVGAFSFRRRRTA